ncbi:PIG-L family deacetylase [Janibacter anophelis]|uniref:PIG-L family deacetylase n=1 Tax=Janibacter anophelis TaxID=319054 RepID=UPI003F7D8BE6
MGTPAQSWRSDPRWPRARDVEEVLDARARVVVVAAHPDDETLGAGSLAAAAVARGIAVELLVLTDGEGSHPESTTRTPTDLAARRRDEAREAAAALGSRVELALLGLPDGGLTGPQEEQVTRLLVDRLGDARDVLLLAPWRRDGHPDHEAAGRATAAAAVRTGARLLEYPVWFWHWASPPEAPWDSLVAIGYDEDATARKGRAMAAHRSQVEPLSDAPGDEVLLAPELLEHFTAGVEVFVEEGAKDTALDDLHVDSSDPWGTAHRWYERRKRDLVLACLPRPHFVRGLELGCSRGELAADLAKRCEALVAVDRSPAAIARARSVVPEAVETAVVDVPSQWPGSTFDLVVLSEVGYFLSPIDLERLFARIASCLGEHGVVVLCHWRHPVTGWVLDGADVHERALGAPGLPPLMSTYRDDDVEILVLASPADRPDPGG